MLIPTTFARLAVCHGTVGTISDPHEIANVNGLDGVEYMIRNAALTPLKIHFGAPSCVPATRFETAGAELSADDIDYLFTEHKLHYLSELMNYPGVLFNNPEVMDKIAVAKKHGVPVDGHAPGLQGQDAIKYIQAGISTDHECFTYEEAQWKADHGMFILIREGSAAKNFEALIDLFNHCPEKIMFCSDDKHPDDLVLGHINQLVARALTKGHNLYDVLHAACVLPVLHYKMKVGLLHQGDPADFIVSDDLTTFTSLDTYINGVLVAEGGASKLPFISAEPINHFVPRTILVNDLGLPITPDNDLRVIHAIDGELITRTKVYRPASPSPNFVTDLKEDILKIVVINRYSQAPPAVGLIHGFGLRQGAIASTVAHDCHNIIAVGVDDASLVRAITALMDNQGGVVATDGATDHILPLPVAGLMSLEDGAIVGDRYRTIDQFSKDRLGSPLKAPFMSLSFMALLVIPSLKLSDLGLFDGDAFKFVNPEFK
ncbi:UNVERIFIED_CONTAM: hypothetical protein GTU68_032155 [Idotea baltica]|nr:hypothetical protein [Idotea baltica]